MFYVILLILLGLLFLMAEVILLPGFSICGVLSLVCYGNAVYMAWRDYGTTAGIIVLVVALVLSAVAIVVSLRSHTWRGLTLNEKINSSTSGDPQALLSVGQTGTTLSRLSPMGKVLFDGRVYEAKLQSGYADAKKPVRIAAFEDGTIVVELINE